MRFRYLCAALFAAGLFAVSVEPHLALARDRGCEREQDCALDAFKSGTIRPLTDVLKVALERVPGEVIKVELEREDGVWVYEIKILTPQGKRREVEIDAKSLRIIKVD